MASKILIAEDEETIRGLLSDVLWKRDLYALIYAEDGEEALHMAREEMPDLILLDVMMPKMDGYEVCQSLKSDPNTASIMIIMLTGMAQDIDRERAKAAGADDYITKPFSPKLLLEKINKLFAQ